MAKAWYVLQTYSQFEQHVKRALIERIEREGLQESFGEILIPSEEVVEMKEGKKRSSQRKFFPGYVLLEMDMNETTWHVVRSISKVSGFVGGTAEKPAPIAQHEVDAIMRRIEEGVEKPRPKTLFEVGEEVRIIDGPFAEFIGTVEEVHYEKSRLKVSVLIFGRPTPVDLEFHQVEKDV
ncbi:transcription termination/antitermination protein NusG [Suttonella sp. R2A3]|uniref:transcription termination/antitermination protein NusG n=1 Tax=Suttonella sp. R2A3 TaxID=2908648 RepID=UPI001F307E0F|nr:transcription termination/antitermination protein NusG [Suttonella sp. R2A3]UJF23767.1 transcription termination/antitermination protein NusG [Suttonella sp. R2A3]